MQKYKQNLLNYFYNYLYRTGFKKDDFLTKFFDKKLHAKCINRELYFKIYKSGRLYIIHEKDESEWKAYFE